VEVDDHAREDVDRVATGRQERAGHPAVCVRDVPEGRKVPLDARQVLEVGRRRYEERIDATFLEQGAQPVAPLAYSSFEIATTSGGSYAMELIHTCYRITDIDRSVAFYKTLGFEERRRMPIREEAINVFMGLPGDGERLELTYNFGVDSYEIGTGYGHIAITVDDMDATLDELATQGIEPERPKYQVSEGGSFIAFVRDPDDYRVELIERK
jgi:lactoylglutathione lyase